MNLKNTNEFDCRLDSLFYSIILSEFFLSVFSDNIKTYCYSKVQNILILKIVLKILHNFLKQLSNENLLTELIKCFTVFKIIIKYDIIFYIIKTLFAMINEIVF